MRPLHALAALTICLAGPALEAQAMHPTDAPRIGIGIDQSAALYVPINITPRVRLEPEVAFLRSRATIAGQYVDQQYGTANETDTVHTEYTRLGLGIMFEQPHGEHFRTYLGPRIGVMLLKGETRAVVPEASVNEGTTSKRTDVYGAFSVGGEYLLNPHFSVGAEGQVRYVHQGDASPSFESTQGYQSASVEGDPTFSTRGLFMIRVYP